MLARGRAWQPAVASGRAPDLTELELAERQLLYLRALTHRARNQIAYDSDVPCVSWLTLFCSVKILCLPAELTQEIALFLVDIAPIPASKPSPTTARGWMPILWVCHGIRIKLFGDGRIWARAYTQLPQAIGIFRGLAGRHALSYRVTDEVPLFGSTRLSDTIKDLSKLDTLAAVADVAACSHIHSTYGGGTLCLLERLAMSSPLTRLRTLELAASDQAHPCAFPCALLFAGDLRSLSDTMKETESL